MNIFYINQDPLVAARELADQHILKMGIESAQMLSTAHWLTGSEAPYKKTHANHPSSIWVRQSISHYRWLVSHGIEILKEYTRRYGKVHKTESIMLWLKDNEPVIDDLGFIEPPKCMPDVFKIGSTIDSYKKFYIEDKINVKKLSYKKTNQIPNWVK